MDPLPHSRNKRAGTNGGFILANVLRRSQNSSIGQKSHGHNFPEFA